MNEWLQQAKRVVIKIGSALLVDPETGALKADWLGALARDVARLRARGQEVLIVSSGSIALGRRVLGLKAGELKLEENQAAAATGQVRLAQAYTEILGSHDIIVAQVLLSLGDTEERRRYLNARNTLETLLGLGVVPVINENDTVATSEIRYGDNDRLAARVASMCGADCLVLLSDVDGFYSADPASHADARLIAVIADITPEIEAMAGEAGSGLSKGGMVTKLMAAKIARQAGCHMVITSGHALEPLKSLEDGARSTWFPASDSPLAARKRWIAGSLEVAGVVVVDDGAAGALRAGKSLLPAGITAAEGGFDRGDAVIVKGLDGQELGRGLSAYSAADVRAIMGANSRDIEKLLGYKGREEVIHRNDLVLLKG